MSGLQGGRWRSRGGSILLLLAVLWKLVILFLFALLLLLLLFPQPLLLLFGQLFAFFLQNQDETAGVMREGVASFHRNSAKLTHTPILHPYWFSVDLI